VPSLAEARRAAVSAAIVRIEEANAKVRKRRALAPLERSVEAAMRRAFRAQGRAFLARLALLKPLFPPGGNGSGAIEAGYRSHAVREVASPVPWEPAFDEAALATIQAFSQPLDEVTAQALASGTKAALADLAVGGSFSLEHPAAVDYLRRRGAERVGQITDTTRTRLRTLLTQAADEGWSYDRTAREIRKRYAGFSATRARNIAVFELGDAYEHGNVLVARDLQDGGLAMEKSWLTVGDDRVRPDHRANQGQGWIPLDDAFGSGDDRPPADPGCRCTLLMRRRPDERRQEPTVDATPAGRFDIDNFEFSFADVDRLNRHMDAQYGAWMANADADELEAVRHYKGAGYSMMNAYLRGRRSGGQLYMRDRYVDVADVVPLVDDAIASSEVPFDAMVFRGTRFLPGEVRAEFANIKPGDILTDGGFVSTTTDYDTMANFAGKSPESYLMQIYVPKGTNGLALDAVTNAPKEHEIVLPRGTSFLVRAVDSVGEDLYGDRSDATLLVLEVIP
jgi:hypothetical protein